VTHASQAQAGPGSNEPPHAPHRRQHAKSRTKLLSAALGVVLAILAVVAGVAIYQTRQSNLQLSEANQLAAAVSSSFQALQIGQAQDAALLHSANSAISSLEAANQSMSSQIAASTALPPSKAGSIYHQAQVTLTADEDTIDITAPPSDPTWGADPSYGPGQRNALSYSARGLRIDASHLGLSAGEAADYRTCASRTDYSSASGFVDSMSGPTVYCLRFADRFGAVKILNSTDESVTLELTTWISA
jgi:type II secretory pathway pseudopilin PulG